jgi:hypothetical protein
MSEIGEGQSYLDVDRRIVRNRVTVNYLGLCGVKLSRLQCLASAWAEEQLLAIALGAERVLGCAAERLEAAPVFASSHRRS